MVLSPNQIGSGLPRSHRLSPHCEEDGDAERDFVDDDGVRGGSGRRSGRRERAAPKEKERAKRPRGHSIVVEEAATSTPTRPAVPRTKRVQSTGDRVDGQISAQLLGPTTSGNTAPFGGTQSSHSFFSEQHQRYRYNAVKVNMSGTKLWSKRDSLGGKKRTPRINAIPSSAGSTPLTTPQQSRRGRVSDDEHDDERDFDEDPHRIYLDMMANDGQNGSGHTADFGADLVSAPTETVQTAASGLGAGSRAKLTDKGAIHDLFDLLQKETLSPASPVALHHHHQHMLEDMDPDHRGAAGDGVEQNEDVHLVSLMEAEDSSSSDSDSSSN